MTRFLPALLLLSACLPEFPKRDFVADPTADNDGDGFTELTGDCDDDQALAYPGADEVCDGIDNDCDGDADEDDALDAKLWYSDGDRDGFGTDAFTVTACEAPSEAYSDNADDCDDSIAAINPNAAETCAPYDENCDGVVNEGEEDGTLDTDIWYKDSDGDGYGSNVEDPIEGCDRPEGYVLDPGDCDDANGDISPRETELCDGIDNNCNDLTDDEDPAMTGDATWYADTDNDGFGDPGGETKEQCVQPAGFVLDATDCDDTNATTNTDATEICNEVDDDCDGVVDDGVMLDFFADADGDGHGDLASPIEACSLPEGFVLSFDDCDDTNPAVNPYAEELCATEGVDDNCDGRVDESDAADATTWYRDADGDGFGDADTTLVQCAEPFSYVAEAGDCDDARATSHPGAVELCGTPTRDDDCDGDLNDDGAEGCTEYWYDGDGDGYGDASLSQCLCLADEESGYDTLRSDDCDDTQEAVHPERAEDCTTLVDDNCSGGFNDEDGLGCTPFWVDTDVDGFGEDGTMQCLCVAEGARTAEAGGDCDDLEFSINPGVDEVCTDEIDNDCDGLTNDATAVDAVVWYRDDDGDGYGVETLAETACEAPGGFTATAGDCDDSRDGINPGQSESCLMIWDEDCSGSDNDVDADHCVVFYADADRDGYPVLDDSRCQCYADTDTSYTSLAEIADCDDTDPAFSPGQPERCDTEGIDDDCSGFADEEDAVGCEVYFRDEDGDTYGIHDTRCFCAPTGAYTATRLGDCDDFDSTVNPAEDNCGLNGEISLDQAVAVVEHVQDRPDWATSLRNYGSADFNRDGISDLFVGSKYEDSEYTNAGAAYIWLGPIEGTYEASPAGGASVRLTHDGLEHGVGQMVTAGDTNGDGFDELIVSAAIDIGFVVDHTTIGLGDISLATSGVSEIRYDSFLIGDLDGDGFDDAMNFSGHMSFGSPEGLVYFEPDESGWRGSPVYLRASQAFGIGDIDGDGVDEILGVDVADAPENNLAIWKTGVEYDGIPVSALSLEPSSEWPYFSGISFWSAEQIHIPGDLTGDGRADVIVSDSAVSFDDPFTGAVGSVGRTYLFEGGIIGGEPALVDHEGDWIRTPDDAFKQIRGTLLNRHSGYSLTSGDWDGDDGPDLAIGAGGPSESFSYTSYSAVGLFYGPWSTDGATLSMDDADGRIAAHVHLFPHSPGDMNGDGIDDLLIYGSEGLPLFNGATYLFHGAPR